MSMGYICRTYGVPAKTGGRIEYTGGDRARLGTIVKADGAYLRIRLDGEGRAGCYHPTWEIRYLKGVAA